MNLMTVKNGAGTLINAGKLYVKDHAPQILMGVAIGSEIGAIGTSCYAMTKMEGIIDAHKADMDDLKLAKEAKTISEKEYQEESFKIYANTGLNVAKYWALPVALTGLSITSGLAAYNKINKKYVGAMASLATLSDKFKLYRGNVIEDVGPERDRVYLNNGILKAKALRIKNGNTNNGTEEKYTDKEIKKATEEVYKETLKQGYKFQMENNPYEFEWSIDTVLPTYFNEHMHIYNVQFVHNYQTQYWNNRLITDGVVTLNQVLKGLGLQVYMSAEFDDIGWCLKEYDERCDGFIDFGFDKSEVKSPERQMWLEPTPDIEQMFKTNPDTDRVMLVMNCCDIREAKKRLYGQYFGKNGKINFIKAYNKSSEFENV